MEAITQTIEFSKEKYFGRPFTIHYLPDNRSFMFMGFMFTLNPIHDPQGEEIGYVITSHQWQESLGTIFEDPCGFTAVHRQVSKRGDSAIEAAIRLLHMCI